MVIACPTGTRAGKEEFLDLICNDTDLLAAEFDAIIAAAWPDPPEQPPQRDNAGGRPDGGRPSRRARRAPARPGEPGQPGIEASSRQRSPPAATTTTDEEERQVIAPREPIHTR